MKRKLKIVIPGKPFSQQRPFFTKMGRVFDRPESVARKREIGMALIVAMKESGWGNPRMTLDPIKMTLSFIGAHGNSDIDNLMKAVFDACTGIIYRDDRQILEVFAQKLPILEKENPRTIVVIEEI